VGGGGGLGVWGGVCEILRLTRTNAIMRAFTRPSHMGASDLTPCEVRGGGEVSCSFTQVEGVDPLGMLCKCSTALLPCHQGSACCFGMAKL
jgi:hypothetical protein